MRLTVRRLTAAALLAAAIGSQAADGPKRLPLQIEGLRGDLLSNVEANLGPLMKDGVLDTQGYHARIETAVRLGLRPLGYYQPQSSFKVSGDGAGSKLIVTVDKGEPVRIADAKLTLTGPGRDDRIFAPFFKRLPKKGDVLNHGLYTSFKGDLTDEAQHWGYFDGEFRTSRLGVALSRHEAYWTLDYDTGKRFRFGKVTYTGSQIDTRFLDNMKPFKEGDYYSADKLAEFSRRMSSMGWFTSVVLAPDFDEARKSEERELPLNAEVSPKKANSVETSIGFSSDIGPSAKVVWKKPWVNRRGHSLSASTQINSKDPQLNLSYKIPRIDNPFEEYWTVNGGYKHTDLNDTESDRGIFSVARHWEFSSGWKRSISLNWSHDHFTQGAMTGTTELLYPTFTVARTRSRGGTMPTWGDSQIYSVSAGTQKVLSDVDFVSLTAQHVWIRTLKQKHRFVFRGNFGYIKSSKFDRLPPDMRFFAGGDRSIRGYDYKKVSPRDANGYLTGATSLLTGSAEYQYNVRGDWWGAVFLDVGEAVNGFANSDWKKGVGAGVRWNSPVGPIKLDLACPVNSIGGSDLNIYIGIGAEL